MVWDGEGMPQMVGPQSGAVERFEIEKIVIAELDRQFGAGTLSYTSAKRREGIIVVSDTFTEEGRFIAIGGKINISSIAEAIWKANK